MVTLSNEMAHGSLDTDIQNEQGPRRLPNHLNLARDEGDGHSGMKCSAVHEEGQENAAFTSVYERMQNLSSVITVLSTLETDFASDYRHLEFQFSVVARAKEDLESRFTVVARAKENLECQFNAVVEEKEKLRISLNAFDGIDVAEFHRLRQREPELESIIGIAQTNLNDERANSSRYISSLNERLATSQQEVEIQKEALQQAHQHLETLNKRLEVKNVDILALQRLLEDTDQDRSALKEKLASNNGILRDKNDALSEALTHNNTLKETFKVKGQHLGRLQEQLTEVHTQVDTLCLTVRSNEKELKQMQNNLAEKDKQVDRLETDLLVKEDDLSRLSVKFTVAQQESDALNEKLRSKEKDYDELMESLNETTDTSELGLWDTVNEYDRTASTIRLKTRKRHSSEPPAFRDGSDRYYDTDDEQRIPQALKAGRKRLVSEPPAEEPFKNGFPHLRQPTTLLRLMIQYLSMQCSQQERQIKELLKHISEQNIHMHDYHKSDCINLWDTSYLLTKLADVMKVIPGDYEGFFQKLEFSAGIEIRLRANTIFKSTFSRKGKPRNGTAKRKLHEVVEGKEHDESEKEKKRLMI